MKFVALVSEYLTLQLNLESGKVLREDRSIVSTEIDMKIYKCCRLSKQIVKFGVLSQCVRC